MENITVEQIVEACPLLYRRCKYLEVKEGWLPMIYELSKQLEDLIAKLTLDEQKDCYAVQVKEKFGSLRFYMSCSSKAMDELIDNSEEMSVRVCEYCAKPGETVIVMNWHHTYCDDCLRKSLDNKQILIK